MTRYLSPKRLWRPVALGLVAAVTLGSAACSSSTKSPAGPNAAGGGGGASATGGSSGIGGSTASGGAAGTDAGAAPSTAEFPPEGAAAVEAWLQTGSYKTWTCESAIHAARSPSPHRFNRICSNTLIAGNAAGSASWPKGAGRREGALRSRHRHDADRIRGLRQRARPTARRARTGTGTSGSRWTATAPHDSATAWSPTASGAADPRCRSASGCHGAVGSDAAHTPTAGRARPGLHAGQRRRRGEPAADGRDGRRGMATNRRNTSNGTAREPSTPRDRLHRTDSTESAPTTSIAAHAD